METNIYLHSLPAELLQFIFSHCSLVSLMQISATCHRLRLQVHEFFKRLLSKQATAHPEVKESLARIGWKKEHQLWTCDCFKLVAGPGLAWSRLNKQNSIKIKTEDRWCSLYDISTTVAGKIFVVTFRRNIIFWESDSNKNKLEKLNSPASLVSFQSGRIDILASYDNVLAISRFDDKARITLFDPSNLCPVTEIVLKLSKYVEVGQIAFAKDTMVVEYFVAGENRQSDQTNIDIWKIDTKNPNKEGISLLNTISHRHSPNIFILRQDLCVNDRFIAVLDQGELKVFQGYQDSVVDPLLIRESRRSYVIDVAMEKAQGDRIAVALRKDTKIVLKVYSATSGRRIIKFEKISKQDSDLRHLEWFGEHLLVVTQEGDSLSMMTWQPGMSGLLTCPLNGPVVGQNSFDEWEILNVDYQGITIAFRDNGYCLSDAHMFFEIWNSKEKTVNGNTSEPGPSQSRDRTRSHIGSRHHPHSPSHHHRQSHNPFRSHSQHRPRSHHSTSRSHHRPFRNHHPHSPSHHRPSRSHHPHSPSAHNRLRSPSHHQPHSQSHHCPSRSRHLQPHSHSYHRPSRSQNYCSPIHHHSQSHHPLYRSHHLHSRSHHQPNSQSHHQPNSQSHHHPSRSHHRPSHSSHHPHSPSHNRDRRSPSFHRLSRSQRSPSRRHHHHSPSHPHPSHSHPHPSHSHPHPSHNHPHPSRNHHHSSSQYPHSARRSRSRSGRRTRL